MFSSVHDCQFLVALLQPKILYLLNSTLCLCFMEKEMVHLKGQPHIGLAMQSRQRHMTAVLQFWHICLIQHLRKLALLHSQLPMITLYKSWHTFNFWSTSLCRQRIIILCFQYFFTILRDKFKHTHYPRESPNILQNAILLAN